MEGSALLAEFEKLAESDPPSALERLDAFVERTDRSSSERVELYRLASLAARASNDAMRAFQLSTMAMDHIDVETCDRVQRVGVELTHAYHEYLIGDAERALRRVSSLDPGSDPGLGAKIAFQHGALLHRSGHTAEADAKYADAGRLAEHSRDRPLMAMIHKNRGVVAAHDHRFDEAQTHFTRALELFEELDISYEIAFVQHSIAVAAAEMGDLPKAFRHFRSSSEAVTELTGSNFESRRDYCEALLVAGLYSEAAVVAGEAARRCAEAGLRVDAAEIMLVAASAWLAAGRIEDASRAAAAAKAAFEAQERHAWAAACRLLELTIDERLGQEVDLDELGSIAATLEVGGMKRQSIEATLLLARLAVHDSSAVDSAAVLRNIAPEIERSSHDLQLAHALVSALDANHRERPSAALDHADDGFRALEAAQRSVGSSELRLGLQWHSVELGRLAGELALRDGDSQLLLRWFDRLAATLSTPMPISPATEPTAIAALHSLRDATLTSDDRSRLQRTVFRLSPGWTARPCRWGRPRTCRCVGSCRSLELRAGGDVRHSRRGQRRTHRGGAESRVFPSRRARAARRPGSSGVPDPGRYALVPSWKTISRIDRIGSKQRSIGSIVASSVNWRWRARLQLWSLRQNSSGSLGIRCRQCGAARCRWRQAWRRGRESSRGRRIAGGRLSLGRTFRRARRNSNFWPAPVMCCCREGPPTWSTCWMHSTALMLYILWRTGKSIHRIRSSPRSILPTVR